MNSAKPKLAILDMNDNHPNQGLRCIKDIATDFDGLLDWKVYDVRHKEEIPDMSYDIYISSGGPGSPHDKGAWRRPYFELIDKIWVHNSKEKNKKKHVFFICYSFQLICEHFQLGEVTKRIATSFGVLPTHKTKEGEDEYVLQGLDDPYYVVDSRDWQVIQPRLEVFEEHGAHILSIERIRTRAEYERAIMAVRLSDEFFGTQFHPEADPEGMKAHFSKLENREKVINNFDLETYKDMMVHLDDPDKITLTHQEILPRFISKALLESDARIPELTLT